MIENTIYSDNNNLVLQIFPKVEIGAISVNGKMANRIKALIYIPTTQPEVKIWCPLNYFQENASLPEAWILDDQGSRQNLERVNRLNSVLVVKKIGNAETIVPLSADITTRILEYFKFDISNNVDNFINFDCYAFASCISNLEYNPKDPGFNYKKTPPLVGDIIVLKGDESLPDSIKHWALFLGDNMYLSKFGISGRGSQSLLAVMTLEGMKHLYECEDIFTAFPKKNANFWTGYRQLNAQLT